MGEITNLPISTKRITELDANTSIEDSDLFVTVNGGVDKNITGLVIKDTMTAIAETSNNTMPSVTGSATFTNATNNITLAGFGAIAGLEVGDVYEVTGTASNNKIFTVEVITDSDNVIVNQAHAGGATTKSLVNETVTCTITLVSKWKVAPLGLGQGQVDMLASRALGVGYTANKNRSMSVYVTVLMAGGFSTASIDGVDISALSAGASAPIHATHSLTVGADSIYLLTNSGQLTDWIETR
jgi:hypothetical protein